MKNKRSILLILICLALCTTFAMLTNGALASSQETQNLEELLKRFLETQGIDHYEVVVHPKAKLITVNIAVDGTAQMLSSGAGKDVLNQFKSEVARICDGLIAFAQDEQGIDLKNRLFFQLINDDWFLHDETSVETPVLLAFYRDKWLVDELMTDMILTISAQNVTEDPAVTYVLNIRSKKFHIPTCDSVERTKEANKRDFFGTREEVVANGYAPCGSCNP